jgi:hypothetical protein
MIVFTVSRASIDAVANHIDHVRQRLIVGIRLGLRDALRGLARAEQEALSSHRRSGLLERILGQGGRVIESGGQIAAVYRPRMAGKQPHYWLEYGTRHAAVDHLLMQVAPKVYRMGREAFETSGQPFFFTTAEGFREQFFEILQARVEEAMKA